MSMGVGLGAGRRGRVAGRGEGEGEGEGGSTQSVRMRGRAHGWLRCSWWGGGVGEGRGTRGGSWMYVSMSSFGFASAVTKTSASSHPSWSCPMALHSSVTSTKLMSCAGRYREI